MLRGIHNSGDPIYHAGRSVSVCVLYLVGWSIAAINMRFLFWDDVHPLIRHIIKFVTIDLLVVLDDLSHCRWSVQFDSACRNSLVNSSLLYVTLQSMTYMSKLRSAHLSFPHVCKVQKRRRKWSFSKFHHKNSHQSSHTSKVREVQGVDFGFRLFSASGSFIFSGVCI